MSESQPQIVEFRCPGQAYPISRAVHLGRLAQFYPGCRRCPHADDTGTLSARQVQRLAETRPRGHPPALFHDEQAGGAYLNHLGPDTAHALAAAFGVFLVNLPVPSGKGRGEGEMTVDPPHANQPPTAVIAGAGRPIDAELLAAVGEGLRWTGCHVVDIGPASAACLAFALDHLRVDGGVLVGNPGDRPQTVGLKFWAAGPWALSAPGSLDQLEAIYRAGVDRPTRTYGSLRRFEATKPYLAGPGEHYHALRPLRLVLQSCCDPVSRYLEELVEPLACRIIAGRTAPDRLGEQVREDEAHFGATIGDDGETCHVLDEQGRRVPPERLTLLLARHLLAERPQAVVVLEEGTPAAVARAIEGLGGRVVVLEKESGDESPHSKGSRRETMAMAMWRHGGIFGGGPSGRFWHDRDGLPLADGLMTLTLLLVLLSRSDRPLSAVLDAEATPA